MATMMENPLSSKIQIV